MELVSEEPQRHSLVSWTLPCEGLCPVDDEVWRRPSARIPGAEGRLDGVVAFDQCTDAFDSGARLVQAAADPVASKNPGVRWFYDTALWTVGTKGIEDTLQAGTRYKLLPVADRIRQDVLILAGAEDHFNPFHQVPFHRRPVKR